MHMDIASLLNLAHQILPADVCQKALAALGVVSLFKDIVPKMLAWGTPMATKAADWTAKALLNSRARPLVLWLAPNIIKFLDQLVPAITQLLNVFKNEFEADLNAATQTAPATPPVAAPAPANEKAS